MLQRQQRLVSLTSTPQQQQQQLQTRVVVKTSSLSTRYARECVWLGPARDIHFATLDVFG
jgi:hypothetical protein